MVYDDKLANRVRKVLNRRKGIKEKIMFGGLSFLLNDKMFCGVIKDDLVVRVGNDRYEETLKKPHARPMDFTGKPIKGFIYVNPNGFKTEKALGQWIRLGFDYAASLKKKK